MKAYRKVSGDYIELDDAVPVVSTLVQVAPRPSVNHTFSDIWATAPMDPAVCWRAKTTLELTAEKDVALQTFLDSTGGKVVKAIALVGIDKGLWTLAELKTKYRSL